MSLDAKGTLVELGAFPVCLQAFSSWGWDLSLGHRPGGLVHGTDIRFLSNPAPILLLRGTDSSSLHPPHPASFFSPEKSLLLLVGVYQNSLKVHYSA